MADAKGLTVKRITKWLRNARAVESGKPLPAKKPRVANTAGVYTDTGPGGVRGLRLVIKSRSNASWILRYQIDHRPRYMGLGSANTFGLDEARKRALAARKELADGRDPLEAKHAQRAAQRLAKVSEVPTFEKCALDYLETNDGEWHNAKHREQWATSLRDYAFPLIGPKPVDQISTTDILRVLEQKVGAMPKRGLPAGSFWMVQRASAMRLRGRIESILAAAKVRHPTMGDNPARWKQHLENVLPGDDDKKKKAQAHHAALPYAELPTFMAKLRTKEGTAARALEFLIMCANRSNEVLGAKWSEVNFDTATWTIPGERMLKTGGVEHRVPLTPTAIALLKNLPTEEGNPFVFVGGKEGAGLGTSALSDMMKRMERVDVTVHGFRSSFRDWAADETNYPRDVAERALSHKIGDKVSQAYERSDLFNNRRKLMETWAKFCNSPPVQKDGNVKSLADARRRRRR